MKAKPIVSRLRVEWTGVVMDRLPIAAFGMGQLAGCNIVISSRTWQCNSHRPTRSAAANPRRLIQVLA